MKIPESPLIDRLVDLALAEDLSYGDLTTELLGDSGQVKAYLLAKEDLVVCGLGLTKVIASRAHRALTVANLTDDGQFVSKGTKIQRIEGLASDIVSLERTILNFLQRLSGVASNTRKLVQQANGLVLLDTRKTTPGFRLLEKYACYSGGARNHRMHLGEMILVKNNHIDSASGSSLKEKVASVMSKVCSARAYYAPVEVEVRSLEELGYVLEFKPQAVLLDNMSDQLILECLALIKQKSPATISEASGGITAERFKSLAKIAVDVVSIGALTTKAVNVDISLKISGE